MLSIAVFGSQALKEIDEVGDLLTMKDYWFSF